MGSDFLIRRTQYRQLEIATLEFRNFGFLARTIRFPDQAVLPAGHCQIDFRQQLGVENQVIFKNVHDGKLANEVAEEFSLEYPADMIQVNGQWLNYADLEDLNQGFTMFKK